jgi:hypothetical protein
MDLGVGLKDQMLGPDEVRRFLSDNPDFLLSDTALMAELGLRPDAANVVEFGPAALARVHEAHKKESGPASTWRPRRAPISRPRPRPMARWSTCWTPATMPTWPAGWTSWLSFASAWPRASSPWKGLTARRPAGG